MANRGLKGFPTRNVIILVVTVAGRGPYPIYLYIYICRVPKGGGVFKGGVTGEP